MRNICRIATLLALMTGFAAQAEEVRFKNGDIYQITEVSSGTGSGEYAVTRDGNPVAVEDFDIDSKSLARNEGALTCREVKYQHISDRLKCTTNSMQYVWISDFRTTTKGLQITKVIRASVEGNAATILYQRKH